MNAQEQLRAALLLVTEKMAEPDKTGIIPAYLHPIRVGCSFLDPILTTVGFLHDIVEDTDVTLEQLTDMGFSSNVVEAVEHMTKRKHEKYNDYLERLIKNDISAKVKLHDIMDNMTRVHGLEVMNTLPKNVTDRMILKWESGLRRLHQHFLGET